MLDHNAFKKSVKDWMRENPEGSLPDLIDFCEEQIPTNQFATSRWIVDQTVSWYKHILVHRELTSEQQDHDFVGDEA